MKRILIVACIVANAGLVFPQGCYPPCSPVFSEIFDFCTGDYFQHQSHEYSMGSSSGKTVTITDSYIITGKQRHGDTLYYSRLGTSEVVKEHTGSGGYKSTGQILLIDDTVSYKHADYNFLDKCAGILLDIENLKEFSDSNDAAYYTRVQIMQKDHLQIKTIGGDNNYFTVDTTGAVVDTVPASQLPVIIEESYARHRGLVKAWHKIQPGSQYTDDSLLAFRSSGGRTDFPKAEISNGSFVELCKGSNLILRANKCTGYTYQWFRNGIALEGAVSDTLEVTESGVYRVLETNSCHGMGVSAGCKVYVIALLLSGSNYDTINIGESIMLTPDISYDGPHTLEYSWNTDSTLSATNIKEPVASPSSSHLYKLSVTDGICTDTTSFSVIVDLFNPECDPDFAQIFDFSVGDYFKYEKRQIGYSSLLNVLITSTDSYKITGKWGSADTLYYTREGTHQEITERNFAGEPSVTRKMSGIKDTLIYIDTEDHYLDQCRGTLLDEGKLLFGYNNGIYTSVRTKQTDCMLIKTIGGDDKDTNYFRVDSTGAVYDTITGYEQSQLMYLTKKSYAKDLGLISEYYREGFNGYTEGSLISYIKAADTGIVSPAEITNGDTVEICQGSNVILRANNSEVVSYQWTKNGMAIPGATFDTLEVSDSGEYRVIEMYGCKSTVTSGITWVLINRLNVQPQYPPAGNNACGKLDFSANIDYHGSKPLTYAWEGDSTLIFTDKALATVNPETSNSYLLTVSNGVCETTTEFDVADPLELAINPVSNTLHCGDTVRLGITSNYTGALPLLYHWMPVTGLNRTDIQKPLLTVGTQRNYILRIRSYNGCKARDTLRLDISGIEYIPSVCMVTVNQDDKNELIWQEEDSSETFDSLYIFRESASQPGEYDLIDKLPYTRGGIFDDPDPSAGLRSTRYRIAVKDVCGFLSAMSPAHKTMHLSVHNSGVVWYLNWESYQGIPVSAYLVYRGTAKSKMSVIATLSGTDTTFTDNTAPSGNIFYRIEAETSQNCTSMALLSNIAGNNTSMISDIKQNADEQVVIYPNPASDKLFIRNLHSTDPVLVILDMQGKQVLRKSIGTDPVDISFLSKGIYIIKLFDSGNIRIDRLVKE